MYIPISFYIKDKDGGEGGGGKNDFPDYLHHVVQKSVNRDIGWTRFAFVFLRPFRFQCCGQIWVAFSDLP